MTDESHVAANRVVVGVDGSEESKTALRWALHLAAATGATVDAVVAWEVPVEVGWAEGLAYQPMPVDPRAEAQDLLRSTVDAVCTSGRPAGLRELVIEGSAATALLQASTGAVALVVGSRGHGGVRALLLGSTSTRCAEQASCPVLVVHGGDRPPPT